MPRRLTALSAALVFLALPAANWALGWAPVYWLAMKVVYRPVDIPGDRSIRDIPYDPGAPGDPKRALDLFLPPAAPFQTVVFIHGGGWTTGDRALTVGGGDVYGNIGRFLAAHGYGAAVISYRLVPDVDWRTQVGDAARAVAWVARHITERGGTPGGLFLMGHSAGAQIATRLAVDARWLADAGLDASIVCGVAAASGAGYDMADQETYRLGNNPDYYAARFEDGSADRGWQRTASPLPLLSPAAPPFLVLYAEGDSPSLRRQSGLLADALARTGVPVTRTVIPGSSHERVVVQLSRDDQVAGPAVLRFLQTTPCPRRDDRLATRPLAGLPRHGS